MLLEEEALPVITFIEDARKIPGMWTLPRFAGNAYVNHRRASGQASIVSAISCRLDVANYRLFTSPLN